MASEGRKRVRNVSHSISLSLLSVLIPVLRFGAGEVGKASLACMIRNVSPFVQVSVRACICSESVTPLHLTFQPMWW